MTSSNPEVTYSKHHMIIEQGEPAVEAYLVMSGEVEVMIEKSGTTTILAILKEGDIFGEAALFKGSDYGASVRVSSDSATLQPILPDVLDARISACDPLIRALVRMLMVRLRKTNEALANPQKS